LAFLDGSEEATMSAKIYGGINIAMKVPPHQYEATVASIAT